MPEDLTAAIEKLFTNGQGELADRLVLTADGPPKRDLGGWCRGAVEDVLRPVVEAKDSEIARLRPALEEARADLRVMAHAWNTDNRPPADVLARIAALAPPRGADTPRRRMTCVTSS